MATPPTPSYNWPGVNNVILDQDAVGWRPFLEGGVLHAWAAKQQEYYNQIKRRNTDKRWITTLIKKLWEISWNMWEQRNGEVNNPESPASLREHVWLDALITTNYEDVSTLAIKDRRWFCCLKEEVLFTESLEYKQQWLESVHLERIQYMHVNAKPPPMPNAPSCDRRFVADPNGSLNQLSTHAISSVYSNGARLPSHTVSFILYLSLRDRASPTLRTLILTHHWSFLILGASIQVFAGSRKHLALTY
jgi:hypothetical protein